MDELVDSFYGFVHHFASYVEEQSMAVMGQHEWCKSSEPLNTWWFWVPMNQIIGVHFIGGVVAIELAQCDLMLRDSTQTVYSIEATIRSEMYRRLASFLWYTKGSMKMSIDTLQMYLHLIVSGSLSSISCVFGFFSGRSTRWKSFSSFPRNIHACDHQITYRSVKDRIEKHCNNYEISKNCGCFLLDWISTFPKKWTTMFA